MSDITNIFGGEFRPPEERPVDPPEVQAREAMETAGIAPPDEIVMDGKIHRFNTGRKKDKSGWYVFFADGVITGRFGDWREDIEGKFTADTGRTLTAAENMALTQRLNDAKKARDEARQKRAETASDTVTQIWDNASRASPDHPYLKRKGIREHGARVTGDGRLIVPLYSTDGELASVQYIDAEGGKKYHPGGKTGACLWCVGSADEAGPVYVAEGFATAATIHEVTDRPCFVAYSASNLVPATEYVRNYHDNVVIVADNDEGGVGQRYAEQAAAKYGARVIVPPEPGDANDYHLAGNDLTQLLNPPQDDWLVQADEFAEKPAPLSWRIKWWVQDNAMIMVHGPSGSGKTFVVLDMMLRIAGGIDEWQGQRVSEGNVVYLAGEGHHGLRGRIAAWKTANRPDRLNMWLSRDGCDLNTAQGYQRVADSLRALHRSPDVIVVDTLHRFLLGDENSAQDTKTMLDACNGLMREFGCTVLLVHHTGNSEEAQHRARGSSAWKGALDTEISVVPPKQQGQAVSVVTRKAKDYDLPAPVYGTLEPTSIPGWFDEDGEQVTSAVFTETEAPPETSNRQDATSEKLKTLQRGWWEGSAEMAGAHPYISRSAMKEVLLKEKSEAAAKKDLSNSDPKRLIGYLVNAGLIEQYSHGWIVIDQETASQWAIMRGESE